MYLEFYVLVVIIWFFLNYFFLYSVQIPVQSVLLIEFISKNYKRKPLRTFHLYRSTHKLLKSYLCEMKETFYWCESLIDIFLCHNVTYHTCRCYEWHSCLVYHSLHISYLLKYSSLLVCDDKIWLKLCRPLVL